MEAEAGKGRRVRANISRALPKIHGWSCSAGTAWVEAGAKNGKRDRANISRALLRMTRLAIAQQVLRELGQGKGRRAVELIPRITELDMLSSCCVVLSG